MARHMPSLSLAPTLVAIMACVIGTGCGQKPHPPPTVAPTSRIMLTAADAERIALRSLTEQEPTLLPSTVSAGRVTTQYPGVVQGRPVYPIIIDGEITAGGHRCGYMMPVVVDATTGEILHPRLRSHEPHALGAQKRD